MNTFLKELASHLYNKHQQSLADIILVFPNRRAGLFFRKSLSEIIETPIWAPNILSMEDFVQKYSVLQVADKITMIFLLYEEYVKVNTQVESFDRFYSWGEIMLKDFDDIDKYLVNTDHLFTSLKLQKELEDKFDYLTQEQKQVIRSFWSSFGNKLSSQQQGFLKIWDILPVVYKNFQKRLIQENLAYEGMIYREVAEKCSGNDIHNLNKKVVFAGFNALSTSEEYIIKFFLQNFNAEIFWDIDKFYMDNPNQEAGTFLRKYEKDKIFGQFFPVFIPEKLNNDKQKNIEIIGVPLIVGQAKRLGEKLLELVQNENLKDLTKTVVVLPEENLLFPVLHSLPATIKEINVTMGFPLKDTSLNSLFEHLISFQQQKINTVNGELFFHYKVILPILRHPLFIQYNSFLSRKISDEIERNNIISVPSALLHPDDPLYSGVFKKIDSVNKLLDYLINIILILNQSLEDNDYEKNVNPEIHSSPQSKASIYTNEFEKEYIFQFYTLINRLKGILLEQDIEINISTFQKLFRQMVSSYRLPFSGEPLLGLQIMGALETRNLDFENVFILSMNEGSFPANNSSNSYIPFNLRKGFSLPTIDQQDSNYAYTFYRLLQRAKNVYLFHNTEVGTNINGEMSRYLFQLIYESNFSISSTVLSNTIKPGIKLPISIKKSIPVFEKLSQYIVQNGSSLKRFTPSALNIYMDCRLKFYFRYIIGLQEKNVIQEKIDPAVFGNILHLIMEKLYSDVITKREEKEINKEDFEQLNANVEKVLHKAFYSYFSNSGEETYKFEGADIIAGEIISKYAYQILYYDKLYAPFQIQGLEANEANGYIYDLTISTINGEQTIGLKGVIDRIDKKNNVVRVIDYKSGSDKKEIESIESLFDRDNPKRNKAAFQTFFYGLLYNEKNLESEVDIMPCIFNIREMFGENFDFRLKLKNEDARGNEPVNNVIPFLNSFKEGLQTTIEEIFDSSVPFDQTNDLKKCSYCPYSGICHRD